MAVYTEVGFDAADALFTAPGPGSPLTDLQGIQSGHREHQLLRHHERTGQWVLTLFERLTAPSSCRTTCT
jgi:hypothetical protein